MLLHIFFCSQSRVHINLLWTPLVIGFSAHLSVSHFSRRRRRLLLSFFRAPYQNQLFDLPCETGKAGGVSGTLFSNIAFPLHDKHIVRKEDRGVVLP
jgi:hypothetical protein